MSLHSLAKKFVDLCNQGKNFDVMRSMYGPNIVSIESDGGQTAGQEPVIKKSEIWQGNNTIHSEKLKGPFFNGKNQFAVHYTLDVTHKETGKRATLEEVGVYTVENDKITREQFYNDW